MVFSATFERILVFIELPERPRLSLDSFYNHFFVERLERRNTSTDETCVYLYHAPDHIL